MDHCVMCGCYVPEGTQVCKVCKNGPEVINVETIRNILIPAKYNPNYKIHSLIKCNCFDCNKAFIVSGFYSKETKIHCPYCMSSNTDDDAAMIDEDGLEELGCMTIGHKVESEG